MLDSLFKGVFDTTATSSVNISDFLLCLGAALIMGIIMCLAYTYKNIYSKSFVVTLALLPSIVCVVIMMVNGNVGAGVAVAGAFSLVRFRSVPGTAKEIGAIFLAMAAGLAAGMGYIGIAFLFVIILCAVNLILTRTGFGMLKQPVLEKNLRITIPEDLDYAEVFEDIFEQYTTRHRLEGVKTTNMGSLFKLTYSVTLKDSGQEKDFIDALRCRNGNLEISSSIEPAERAAL